MATLVIAADHEKGVRVADLVCQEQEADFRSKIASIYVITQEQILMTVEGGVRKSGKLINENKIIIIIKEKNIQERRTTDLP